MSNDRRKETRVTHPSSTEYLGIVVAATVTAALTAAIIASALILNKKKFTVVTRKTKTSGGVTHYVINLEKSKKRWNDMRADLEESGVDYERIEGYDGRSLLRNDTESLSLMSKECMDSIFSSSQRPFHHSHNAGSVGCYISHLRALRRFLESGEEYGVVMEDDVSLLKENAPYLQTLSDMVRGFPVGWDAVMLGYTLFTGRTRDTTIKDVRRIPSPSLLGERRLVIKSPFCMANHYIVSKEGATRILSFAIPIDVQYDWFLSREMLADRLDIWVSMEPLSGVNENWKTSCINHGPVQKGVKWHIRRPWEVSLQVVKKLAEN